MVTRANRTDGSSTAGQRARHAGVELVNKLYEAVKK
jgi:hypothetical protein